MSKRTVLYLGTSGWMYRDWKKTFYPVGLSLKDELSFFVRHFNTVEINNTFYRIPQEKTVRYWYDNVPDDFVFAVKLNNYMTHAKKLIVDDRSQARLKLFMRAMSLLQSKTRALLVQLPPNFKANPERLNIFLAELTKVIPQGQKVFCEFRDPSWLVDEIYKILRAYAIGLVVAAYPGELYANYPITSDAVYIRYHASQYRSNYSDRELDKWAAYIKSLAARPAICEIFVYFNNDRAAYAIKNAQYLQKALKVSAVLLQ